MTREEFVINYINVTHGCIWTDDKERDCLLTNLIGSIYDLQQQIAQLQERIDERS